MVCCKECNILLCDELIERVTDGYDSIYVCPKCGCSVYESDQHNIDLDFSSDDNYFNCILT